MNDIDNFINTLQQSENFRSEELDYFAILISTNISRKYFTLQLSKINFVTENTVKIIQILDTFIKECEKHEDMYNFKESFEAIYRIDDKDIAKRIIESLKINEI